MTHPFCRQETMNSMPNERCLVVKYPSSNGEKSVAVPRVVKALFLPGCKTNRGWRIFFFFLCKTNASPGLHVRRQAYASRPETWGGATTLPRGYDTCRTHRIRQTRGKKQKHKTPKEHNRGLTRKKWYRAKKARVHGYFVSALDDTVGRCDPPALEVAGRPRT